MFDPWEGEIYSRVQETGFAVYTTTEMHQRLLIIVAGQVIACKYAPGRSWFRFERGSPRPGILGRFKGWLPREEIVALKLQGVL